MKKKIDIENHLNEIEEKLKDIDYRESNQKAGYVYVISNIGSFGPDVYKIGMTRRLDPLERIKELSDASVPFNFNVHALIFSEDAPAGRYAFLCHESVLQAASDYLAGMQLPVQACGGNHLRP